MLVAVVVAAALLVAAAIGLQAAIPRIAANRVRRRLTEGGGSAEVEIAALPASRLLRNRGDRLTVRGRNLEISLGGGTGDDPGRAGLSALDGFEDVDVELLDFRTGPFAIAAFVLARSGGESYAMATQGAITGAELIRLGEGLLGGLPVGPLLGAVSSGGIPLVPREVSISVQIELISEEGRLRVGGGGGSIAGFPAGPIATAIAAAVARRLELVP